MAKKLELRLGTGNKDNLDGGLNYDEESSIDITQSPYDGLLNMSLDKGGILSKRNGQSYIINDFYGTVNGIYTDYKGFDIVHVGTNLYKGNIATASSVSDLTLINSTLNPAKSKIFEFNRVLYILDQNEYYQYDLTDFKKVEGYVPLVNMNRKPDGSSSTSLESWNMITSAFRNQFNADGTSTVYQLSLTSLDVKDPIVKVNGVKKTTGFTVDYALGTITFTSAPTKGDNNVEITAYRTFTTLRDNIVKCTLATEFCSRMFVSGNPNEPNSYFAGGITDSYSADYFPQKYLYKIGSSRAVTGLKVHNNKLIVLKEDMICAVNYETGLDNSASFPITYLHTDIGCNIPSSVQLINNSLVFGNTHGGIYAISSTTIQDERAITNISKNVNGGLGRTGLLSEINLKNAISVVHDQKYILAINDRCYVLDYSENFHTKEAQKNKWFLWDNISAKCFAISDSMGLIYGTTKGIVGFISSKMDFGSPIYGKWKSKVMDFQYPEFLKIVTNGYITLNTETKNTTIKCSFFNENKTKESTITLSGSSSFNFADFNFEDFSFAIKNFDKSFKRKIRAKKICYFQMSLSNNVKNEDLAIKNISLEYRLLRKVR